MEILERRSHRANITGAWINGVCLLCTAVNVYLSWRMLQIMEHPPSSPSGGVAVTIPIWPFVVIIATGILGIVAVLINARAWWLQGEISKKFPRIYPSVKEPGEVKDHQLQTRLVLENRGELDAHEVNVGDIQLRVGTIRSFSGLVGVIPVGDKAEITQQCDSYGPGFSRNIIVPLKKEFASFNDGRESISIPVLITYSDFRRSRYRTKCDLVFNGIVDSLKPELYSDWRSVEFHNFEFGKDED
jgi:hypothetical protein